MSQSKTREPIQKRSVETKEKIIQAGFDLICNDGYYNTNTAKIAKKAGVSTGIIYQYFNNKRDIFLAGLDRYADNIFYPMLNVPDVPLNKKDLPILIERMIKKYINNHKLSTIAHEEITSMAHSDKDLAKFFYEKEMKMTNRISDLLIKNNFEGENIKEKVHVIISMVENLCHEIVYHKHKEIDYNIMTDIVIKEIENILNN